MTEKKTEQLADVLEFCLANLEAGMTMEETLEKVPDHKEEIRPLLETALAARSETDGEIPAGAIHRSRTRMLVRAEQLRLAQAVGRTRRVPWLRMALQLVGVLIVVSASLTSLFAVSAKTVPGDNLYRIKRFGEDARLSLSSSEGRTRLLSAYRERRIDEIKELLRLRRAAPVVFEGVVTERETEHWIIGGLDVVITPNTLVNGHILNGMFVEVQGQTTEDGQVRAINIYLRAYAFIGTLEEVRDRTWIVNGVPVLITDESQLAPNIAIGTQVVVLAQVDNDGRISARAVLLADGTGQGLSVDGAGNLIISTATPIPSATPSQTATPSPTGTPSPTDDSGEEFEPTEDGDDNSGSSSDDDPDETDEPDDDDSSNSGSSPSNTPEPTRTPKATKTPEPTRTEEPTKTPEPTETDDD